ncbi:MAG: DUF2891 family protein [Myxococcales bacterium]|nr:DUF2891 family protein [Myxococcales bacterium]
MSQSLAERLATLALTVIRTESPHCYDAHGPTPRPLTRSAPLTPRSIHPAFYGCYDWHSAVHSHWLLSELLGRQPASQPRWQLTRGTRQTAEAALLEALETEKLQAEYVFLRDHPRFERPYGWAWALRLCRSLEAAPSLRAARSACAALEELCATRLLGWLEGLPYPIRSGEHGQSAFALALLLDWAQGSTHRYGRDFHERAVRLARRHFGADRAPPLHLEPSGNDFLSPSLAAADVLTRALDAAEFSAFADHYFHTDLPEPVGCPDPSDGKLAHLVGLNLSRAWMLLRIARHLPPGPTRAALTSSADAHRRVGLAQCHCEDLVARDGAQPRDLGAELPFALSHWIGSFVLLMEDELSNTT